MSQVAVEVKRFDVRRLDPVEVVLDAILCGPEAAILNHMARRIDETIGEEVL